MADVVLSFDHISKRYRIPPDPGESVGLLAKIRRNYFSPPNTFWAVHDLSFEVPRGQALGIIGHNGAGKSTILKLLSGITAPSEGVITTRGRIAALLEVGSGFHPELTGRENVFLSGTILGMSRREIHQKLDSIIEFAEIRSFIDVPVKRYSSGMYVRLGFSIAAHLEPDILLLDEVLAVGDTRFQNKSKKRILDLKAASTTIIFISHDLNSVEQVCDRVLVMRKGRLVYDGHPRAAVAAYQKPALEPTGAAEGATPRKPVTVRSLELLDGSGHPVKSIATGCPLRIRIRYSAHAPLPRTQLKIWFHSPDWQVHCTFVAGSGYSLDLLPGPGMIEFACNEFLLQSGLYYLDPMFEQDGSIEPLERVYDHTVIQVIDGPLVTTGTFHHPHIWSSSLFNSEGDVSEVEVSKVEISIDKP